MTESLQCQRAAFSLPADLHYLNCAYMGPLPRVVQEAGAAGIARKADPSRLSSGDFFTEVEEVRERFARLLGSDDANGIAIVPAASYGIATAARNTAIAAGQNIVVTGQQFPSNVYVWRELSRKYDAELRVVARPHTIAGAAAEWSARLVEAIDADTAAVALPHVHWTDGTRFDLVSIGQRARAVGAALVVDATQSLGALPFDQRAIQADAVICASYKWLLGPYSLGAAYFGPRYHGGEPLEYNWITRAGSEDFRGLVDYADEYEPGAKRYDVGERSNMILMPMLRAALDLILEWQPHRIQEYCERITTQALTEIEEIGFAVEPRAWRGSHLFGLRAPSGIELESLHRLLQERRVFASLRGPVLRVSPNVYNDESDLAALVDVLRAAVHSART